MCLSFDVRHGEDEINLLSLKGAADSSIARAREAAVNSLPPGIPNGQAGQVFVSTKGSTSPSRPPTRAEQEVHSAAERLNSQVEDALAAVSAGRTPDGVDEIEACADRFERAARDLSVALRELAEERREQDAR
jgi:hypothetical protein